ncbi:MAG: hypothetical protein LBT45_03115, partial [Rickettsiales bacterium]|nr:hypothetical protein [Rickettsiales bacterium]
LVIPAKAGIGSFNSARKNFVRADKSSFRCGAAWRRQRNPGNEDTRGFAPCAHILTWIPAFPPFGGTPE